MNVLKKGTKAKNESKMSNALNIVILGGAAYFAYKLYKQSQNNELNFKSGLGYARVTDPVTGETHVYDQLQPVEANGQPTGQYYNSSSAVKAGGDVIVDTPYVEEKKPNFSLGGGGTFVSGPAAAGGGLNDSINQQSGGDTMVSNATPVSRPPVFDESSPYLGGIAPPGM